MKKIKKPKAEQKINSSAKSAKVSKATESARPNLPIEKIAELLPKLGLKVTTTRMLVFDILNKNDKPLTVPEISKKLGSLAPDQTTIYRVLDQAVTVGFAKKIHLKDSIVRYEIAGDCCCHHVVCRGCGLIEHIDNEAMERTIKQAVRKVKSFALVDEHNLEFFGLCKSCAK